MATDRVAAWRAELAPVLRDGTSATCLYHALYGRDGVMKTDLVKRLLPLLHVLIQKDGATDAEFEALVVSFLPKAPEEGSDELALFLRALVGWRMYGPLPEAKSRAWADVNGAYLEGELPEPEEYCQNDEEGMALLMQQMAEAWEAHEKGDAACDLWVGIAVKFASFVNVTPLWHYCEMRDIHDFYTAEYTERLAEFLASLPLDEGDVVLEVGAGQGALTKFLRREPALKEAGLALVATDADPFPDVEALSYQAALRKYAPKVVLCSWMPYGEDWTPAFRDCGAVLGYVLMGPLALSGCLAGWSLPAGGAWQAMHLEDIEAHSICKLDSVHDPGNTKTIWYQRR
eukprot:TRINITY_DN3825_c0_g2_i1.p1 TRINITY_DN3825_c0_g2~~TRINITY_DN3825_c0_g2_i1.p1  ORF type:complete len:344 (+),score=119.04 TRINITY_DN3825_c0_g2_i1:55-1086(+)